MKRPLPNRALATGLRAFSSRLVVIIAIFFSARYGFRPEAALYRTAGDNMWGADAGFQGPYRPDSAAPGLTLNVEVKTR